MLDAARELHRRVIEPALGRPIGALPEDIKALEEQVGYKLPLVYREFLLWLGRDNSGVFKGSDFGPSEIAPNTTSLLTALAEQNITAPAVPVLSFFSHQGYSFLWFELGQPEQDPVVFAFSEAFTPAVVRKVGSFSSWLVEEFAALAGALPANKAFKPTGHEKPWPAA